MMASGDIQTRSEPSPWAQEVVRADGSGIPFRLYAPRPITLSELLDVLRMWPDRTALVQGDRRLTFAEFLARTHVVAELLRERGVGPGARVALLGRNSISWLEVLWATQRLGAVAVPLNGWWAAREIDHALALTTPSLAFVDDAWLDRLPASVARLATTEVERFQPDRIDESSGVPEIPGGEDDPAMVIFTSGTTGLPKGAEMSRRALIATQLSMLVATRRLPGTYGDDATVPASIVAGPLFHTAGLQMHLTTWLVGGTVILLGGRFDSSEVLELMERERVTTFSGVPTMMTRLLEDPTARSRDFSALRTVGLGGAPVTHRLIERVGEVFPAVAHRVSNTYGTTETGGAVVASTGRDVLARPGTSGRAFPLVDIRIHEPDDDGVGELCVRTPSQMTRFVGVADSPIDAEGWVHTGDLARIDEDGYVFVVGRLKDVVIRGGENVAAGAVEAVLAQHHSVAEVAVVGLPDEDFGEVVAAVVVGRATMPVDTAELADFARSRLAYFEVPTRWWVHPGPLPTNEPGKVDKKRLQADFPSQEPSLPSEEPSA
jgi:long-chain acyl-CoA synthetase